MKQRVVTLMWGTAWQRYGQDFCRLFDKFWPKSVELHLVTDWHYSDRATNHDLDRVPEYRNFMARYADRDWAMGYGCTDRKADPKKRFWKKDAVKWAPQGMVPVVALEGMNDGDIFCWLDADVVTIKKVPETWLGKLLNGHDVACIRRGTQHPEIGFWAIRVSTETRQMVWTFADIYESGDFTDLKEWHSGYVFAEALSRFRKLKIQNLNPTMMRGHPWPRTPLSKYLVHKKGKLK